MDETQKRSLRQQIIRILQLNADGEYSAADVVSDLCELIERGGPRITAVRIVHQVDGSMLGISAEAVVDVDSDVGRIMRTVTSSGRSGVESDGDDAHRREVAGEQRAELQEILSAFDVTPRLPALDEIAVVQRC